MSELSDGYGIWGRVSPGKREEDVIESTKRHIARGHAWAQVMGRKVVEVYDLAGVSGDDVLNTDEGRRMLADVRSGRIKGLICSNLYRLVRNTSQALEIADIFEKAGCALVCLDQQFDTSTPSGRAFFTIVAALGQLEREETANRIAASIPIRAQMGKSTGGPAPYGYQWEGNQLQLHPEEAPIRAWMFDLYLEHQTFSGVARTLNAQGYRPRSRKGKVAPWREESVMRMVLSPTAKGIRKANYTTSKTRRKKGKSKTESDWIECDVPAIVNIEKWDACQALYLKRGKQKAQRGDNLFAGVLVCGCGARMYADSNPRKKYRCLKCHAKIKASTLEQIFSRRLWQLLESDGDDGYLGQVNSALATQKNILTQHQQALAKLERTIAQLNQECLDGELSGARFETLASAAEKKANVIRTQIAAVTGTIDALQAQRLSSDQSTRELRGVLARWESFSQKDKHLFIREIVERLEYREGEVLIDLGLPPDVLQILPVKLPDCEIADKSATISKQFDTFRSSVRNTLELLWVAVLSVVVAKASASGLLLPA